MTTIFVAEQEKNQVRAVHDTAAEPPVCQVGGVQSITRTGSTATATQTAHGYPSGIVVAIAGAGAGEAEYNGDQTITVVDADTYTFAVSGTPATPATGDITASAVTQSLCMNHPAVLFVESIAAATTVLVEACIRRSLGWKQVGASLTNADNGTLVPVAAGYNFVRTRRSSGTGAVKIHAQQ
jgi:hypothetical protein